jgi:uncharacterized protein YuzE
MKCKDCIYIRKAGFDDYGYRLCKCIYREILVNPKSVACTDGTDEIKYEETNDLKYTYDPIYDCLMIHTKDRNPENYHISISEHPIIVDVDKKGMFLGIEIHNIKKMIK